MRVRTLFIALVALALLATACGDAETTEDETTTTTSGATTTVDPKADWPESIVFGFIPSERQETLQDNIEPFMDYIADEIGIDVEGIVTADYNGLVVALGTDGADFGAFGPFGYVQAKDQYPDIEVLIQSVRFGSGTYHGQWFTNDPSICDEPPVEGALENENGTPVLKAGDEVVALQVGWSFGDSGLEQEVLADGTEVDKGQACIASLESVRGKSVAFTSSTSTSGAVFPQLQLLELGIDIESDITYSYLGSHTDTVQAVYNGDFDIGLSFDDARRNIRRDADGNPLHPDVGSKVIVFNITEEIPNDVVAVRGALPDSLKQAVYDAIAKYLETEEGELVLDEIYGWTDIRPADEAEFAVVRAAAEQLGVTED